jgi:hypothetical protein
MSAFKEEENVLDMPASFGDATESQKSSRVRPDFTVTLSTDTDID